MTNCPNCGAPVSLNADACAYCDTPYTPRAPTKDPSGVTWKRFTFKIDPDAMIRAMEGCILTLNQVRRLLDLDDIGG